MKTKDPNNLSKIYCTKAHQEDNLLRTHFPIKVTVAAVSTRLTEATVTNIHSCVGLGSWDVLEGWPWPVLGAGWSCASITKRGPSVTRQCSSEWGPARVRGLESCKDEQFVARELTLFRVCLEHYSNILMLTCHRSVPYIPASCKAEKKKKTSMF